MWGFLKRSRLKALGEERLKGKRSGKRAKKGLRARRGGKKISQFVSSNGFRLLKESWSA